MLDDCYIHKPGFEPLTVPALWTDRQGPMAVLSAAPARAVWRGARVLGAAAAQGLIVVALFGGIRIPAAPVEPATIEMIQVPPVPQAAPAPEPPSEPAVAAPKPEMPAQQPPPMAALPEPAPEVPSLPPPVNPVPKPQPVTQQQPVAQDIPLPKPSVAPEVASLPAQPKPSVVLPPPRVARRLPPKPGRPPLLAVRRPASMATTATPPVPTPALATAALTATAPGAAARNGSAQTEPRAEDTLRGQIRDAVQAAVRCPPAAQMMGRSGRAGVAFDYRDGVITGELRLVRSTGTPMLDAAALTAVRDAHYPKAPPEVADQVLRLLIWVDEACGG